MTFVRLNASLLVLLLIGGNAVAQPSERMIQAVPAALTQPVADGAMSGRAAW